MRPRFSIPLPAGSLELGERTLVMGVLNVTPDSFSDGGRYLEPGTAAERALEMEREGADLIDIGGESTRPGSARVDAEEELRRVLPVFERLRPSLRVPLSVDTWKPEVAERAVAAGASVINYPALGDIASMSRVASRLGVALLLMHVRGRFETMHQLPPMADVVGEVAGDLRALLKTAADAGLPPQRVLLDPGFGFGKNGRDNYILLARLGELRALERPVVAGTSRKSFLGLTLKMPPAERIFATAATVTAAILGGAHIVRVHDVAAMVQVARVADEVLAQIEDRG